MSQDPIPFISDDDIVRLHQQMVPLAQKFSCGTKLSEVYYHLEPADPGIPLRFWEVRRNSVILDPVQGLQAFDVINLTWHRRNPHSHRFHATVGECLAWIRESVSTENLARIAAYYPHRNPQGESAMGIPARQGFSQEGLLPGSIWLFERR